MEEGSIQRPGSLSPVAWPRTRGWVPTEGFGHPTPGGCERRVLVSVQQRCIAPGDDKKVSVDADAAWSDPYGVARRRPHGDVRGGRTVNVALEGHDDLVFAVALAGWYSLWGSQSPGVRTAPRVA